MRRYAAFLLAVSLIGTASLATAQTGGRLRERILERLAERKGDQAERLDRTGTAIAYGRDPAQRLLFWPGASGAKPPLAVFVHGGGWAHGQPELVDSKPDWFSKHGWAFASVGYRLLPDAPVEEQARDVGRALAALRAEAATRGYDPDRILLLGHSAGAHLAALVSSDPQYAGEAFAAIRGAILIDGACYDVPSQIKAQPFMARRTYIPAFGTDPARQRALSPVTHAGGRDVGDWLMLYTAARDDAAAQSKLLGAALQEAGARVAVVEIPAKSRHQLAEHLEINRSFGVDGYAGNAAIESMMKRVAG